MYLSKQNMFFSTFLFTSKLTKKFEKSAIEIVGSKNQVFVNSPPKKVIHSFEEKNTFEPVIFEKYV